MTRFPSGWFLLHPGVTTNVTTLDCFGGHIVTQGESAMLVTDEGTQPLPTLVAYGALFCWYDASGAPPLWTLPEVACDGFPAMSYFTMTVRTTPDLVMRDLADYRHFEEVHGYRNFTPVVQFETHDRVAHLRANVIRDQPLPVGKLPMQLTFDCTCHGVGVQVADVLALRGLLKTRHLVCPTPIDASHCRVTLGLTAAFWASRDFEHQSATGRLLSRFAGLLVPFFRAQYRRDVAPDAAMWERLFDAGGGEHDDTARLRQFQAWREQFFSSQPAGEPLHIAT